MNQITFQPIRIDLYSKSHLETEKRDFLTILGEFLNNLDLSEYEKEQINGRPKASLRDIIKCLLITNYLSWSYRRARSDLEDLKEKGFLESVPERATLNRYMQNPELKHILERLIEISAMTFIDVEDCMILDSTQFFDKILMGGSKSKLHHEGKLFKTPSLRKTRKMHCCVASNHKLIVCARTSIGTVHDHNYFQPLLEIALNLGYRIKKVLADAAYNSKDSYIFCEDNGIQAWLDFKSNHKVGRSKSFQRKRKLIMYRENPEEWHKDYRMRVLVEHVFSVIKRKGINHLRSRNDNAKDCEMLLKALWYNLCVIARDYYKTI